MKQASRRVLIGSLALAAAVAGTAGVLWRGGPGLQALLDPPAEGGPGDDVGHLLESIETAGRPSGWIIDASAELRAEPTERAAVRATLARATPLIVRDEGAGWARVTVYGRKLEGWVRSSAIGASQEATHGSGP